jgi:hypothetical protein
LLRLQHLQWGHRLLQWLLKLHELLLQRWLQSLLQR